MQSFEDFIKTLPLDYPMNTIVQAYMQDWHEGRPIDGGVAFETQLRTIALDGSLASLATLDRFLDAVKPRLAPDMVQVSQTAAQRNLLTFIAFYAGLVFCYQAQQPAYWVSFVHLTTAFPPLLKVINDDFSYSMAVSYNPIGLTPEPFIPAVISQTTFFPLVTIIERLYPVRNQALLSNNSAPFFGFVTDSLLSSVEKLLQNLTNANIEPQPLAKQAVANQIVENHTAETEVVTMENISNVTNADSLSNSSVSNLVENPTALEKNNHIRFNPFRNHKLFYLTDNPFLSLPQSSPYIDEALFEPFGHPFIASQPVATRPVEEPKPSLSQANSYQPSEMVIGEQNLEQVNLSENLTPLTQNSETPDITANLTPKNLAQQARENRKKPTTSDIKQLQKTQKSLAKQQKERQEALKKSLAEKAEQQRQAEIAEALANPRIHDNLLHQSHSMLAIAQRQAQQKDSFGELEADLNNSDLQEMMLQNNPKLASPLQHGKSLDDMYKQAKQVLDNFNQLIQTHSHEQAKNQQSQDFEITPQQQSTIAQAIDIIQKTAKAGHTDAMLWLALHEFRGDAIFGITQNSETALVWVNQAATLADSRAEKLLSKLYYRGEGVPMDMDLGNYWLELAAEHGHPEAKAISQQMAMAKMLKENRKDESNYLRYLLWGIAVLVTLAFLAVAFIKV